MERRKSKRALSFPLWLDMNKFLNYGTKEGDQEKEDNVYELAGILLHKGTSAYHGHYEAQVYDTESVQRSHCGEKLMKKYFHYRQRSWYQFNDEVVTKIKMLGDKKKGPKDVPIIENNEQPR